jgi:hypothetical protein
VVDGAAPPSAFATPWCIIHDPEERGIGHVRCPRCKAEQPDGPLRQRCGVCGASETDGRAPDRRTAALDGERVRDLEELVAEVERLKAENERLRADAGLEACTQAA